MVTHLQSQQQQEVTPPVPVLALQTAGHCLGPHRFEKASYIHSLRLRYDLPPPANTLSHMCVQARACTLDGAWHHCLTDDPLASAHKSLIGTWTRQEQAMWSPDKIYEIQFLVLTTQQELIFCIAKNLWDPRLFIKHLGCNPKSPGLTGSGVRGWMGWGFQSLDDLPPQGWGGGEVMHQLAVWWLQGREVSHTFILFNLIFC